MLHKSANLHLILAGTLLSGVFSFSAYAQTQGKSKVLSAREKRYAEFSQLPDPSVVEKIDREKILQLSEKKLAILKKMHRTRLELIRKDQKLSSLRKKILSLSLELSQELNAKQEMLLLNEELAVIEGEIKDLTSKMPVRKEKKQIKK